MGDYQLPTFFHFATQFRTAPTFGALLTNEWLRYSPTFGALLANVWCVIHQRMVALLTNI